MYSKLVSKGSYCIVFDTVIEYLPNECCENRSWSVGNNPLTAVKEWLLKNKNFEIDYYYDKKAMISVAKEGYLKRVN